MEILFLVFFLSLSLLSLLRSVILLHPCKTINPIPFLILFHIHLSIFFYLTIYLLDFLTMSIYPFANFINLILPICPSMYQFIYLFLLCNYQSIFIFFHAFFSLLSFPSFSIFSPFLIFNLLQKSFFATLNNPKTRTYRC